MTTVVPETAVSGLRPEVELLLCCARTRVEEARTTQVRALAGDAAPVSSSPHPVSRRRVVS